MKSLFVNVLAIFLLNELFSWVNIADFTSVIVIGLVLTLLNATIKPILKFLSFPITFITFGLFSIVVNAFILELSFSLAGSTIASFGYTMIASIIIGIVNSVLNKKD